MSKPKIIRTFDELEEVDPGSWLMNYTNEYGPIVMQWADWDADYRIDTSNIFPLAVVIEGQTYRDVIAELGEGV